MGDDIGLLDGLATTRAIRRYRDEPIPDDDLATILFSATRAPTGSNRQGFRFLVLRHGPRATEAKGLLGQTFRRGWRDKQASDGYRQGTGRSTASAKARMAETMQHFVDNFERTPVVILACVRVRHRDGIPDGQPRAGSAPSPPRAGVRRPLGRAGPVGGRSPRDAVHPGRSAGLTGVGVDEVDEVDGGVTDRPPVVRPSGRRL